LEWALRRKLYIALSYDERGKPIARRLLKQKMFRKQAGRCAKCGEILPEKVAVLDRFEAMSGYTEQNTRLLCPSCNVLLQEERHYA
jgi:uncharacterized protein with PIN domain